MGRRCDCRARNHREDSETTGKPGYRGLSDFAQVKINDRSNFWGVLSEPELNGTDFAVLCVVLLTPLNCRILGLHDCDTERREAPLIPEMETGICRVAPRRADQEGAQTRASSTALLPMLFGPTSWFKHLEISTNSPASKFRSVLTLLSSANIFSIVR